MATVMSNPVELKLESASPEKVPTGVLILGAFSDGILPVPAKAVDHASHGKISDLIARGDLEEKAGASMLLQALPGVAADRTLLVSLGKLAEFGDRAYRNALTSSAKMLAETSASDAAVTLVDVEVPGRSPAWRVQEASRLFVDGTYRFDAHYAKPEKKKYERGVHTIALLTSGKVDEELRNAAQRGQAVAEGMALAKDLGNLPGNVCNPSYLAKTALALGKELNFGVEVLEGEDMKKLGMGAALSVGQGSAQPCKFIVMNYEGGQAKGDPVVLIGKGVTFDSGGISLKPGANMDEMKFDMCGAASVFGAMRTAARMKLPIHLVGIIPAAENMPGGNASRPGDVVTSMSGQTIEILNTDAEGRLGLADALTYAERFQPAYVIDIATLTGACVIALGNLTSGLFANDDGLAEMLLQSGQDTGDRAWRLPMFDEYQELLKSNFADMSNIGGRPAGAITAACFLKRFANHFKWAHLDIAGTNAISGDAKGATGRPVPLLTEFLFRHARAAMQEKKIAA